VNVPNTVVADAAAPREPKKVTELIHLLSNLVTSLTIGKLCERKDKSVKETAKTKSKK
jgi:hypothetical protein